MNVNSAAFVDMLSLGTKKLNNRGIIPNETSAYFNSSILEVHINDCRVGERCCTSQDLFNTRNLYLPYPNEFWFIFSNSHMGVIQKNKNIANLFENINTLENACVSVGLVPQKLFLLVSTDADEKLGIEKSVQYMNVVVAKQTSKFNAGGLLGDYAKLFYSYNDSLIPISVITFAQSTSDYFLSDMMINLDNIEYICDFLPRRHDLSKYSPFVDHTDCLYGGSHDRAQIIELEYAIVEGLSQIGHFASRGRGYILKEVFKKYLYVVGDSLDMGYWENLLRRKHVANWPLLCQKMTSISKRELPLYKNAIQIASNENKYYNDLLDKYGLTARLFNFAKARASDNTYDLQKYADLHQMSGCSKMTSSEIKSIIKVWAENGKWSV